MSKETFIPAVAALSVDFSKGVNTSWLNQYRLEQSHQLEKSVFPHNKIEHFKYNCLDIFDNHNFCQLAEIKTNSESLELDSRSINGLAGTQKIDQIVFVNGHYSEKLSQVKHHRITSFEKADSKQQEKIIAMLKQQDVTHNPFILLNAALSHHGILIEIDESSSDTIIEILSIVKPGATETTTAIQMLFDIAENTKATAISRTISWDTAQQQTALSTARTIVNIGEKAEFTHYHLQLENPHSLHFGSIEYNLQTGAKLDAFCAATGGHLKKIDIEVNHLGQYTHVGLDGLYVATDNQQVDYHTTVNHKLPNGTTDENFRGIINGSAKGVFNGRIHIHPDAQKTLAELSNKNLLMSDGATIHTKPELEIYADDVICAHGATVSRMDDESMYYLQARGIDKEEAEVMLSLGFINELLGNLPDQAVADYIRPILFKRFDTGVAPYHLLQKGRKE